MATKRKSNSKGNAKARTTEVVPVSFEEFLYKTRLNWTKHVIPVCYRDPDTHAYIEGYIVSKVSTDKSSEDEEEVEEEDTTLSLKSPLNIRSAYFGTLFCHFMEVDIKHIYPSNRKLTIIEGRELDNFKYADLYPDYIEQFKVKPVQDNRVILDTFEKYKGVHWTLPEMACMVNKQPNEITEFVEEHLTPSYKRVCKITNQEEVTYRMADVKKFKHSIRHTVEELISDYEVCTACSLGVDRLSRNCKITPGRGNRISAKVFFIGEAPGVEEEKYGIPFYPKAPAGDVLSKVLKKAGISEADYYITNAVMCRPASDDPSVQNGKPEKEHIRACNSRLKNELLLLNPEVVVLLGKIAYIAYFGHEPEGVLKSTGWIDAPGPKVYFLPHPSYIARQLSNSSEPNKIKLEYLSHFENIKKVINSL